MKLDSNLVTERTAGEGTSSGQAKRARQSRDSNNNKNDFDELGATNYTVTVTADQKASMEQMLEDVEGKELSQEQLTELYNNTRPLQRSEMTVLSIAEQQKKYPWLSGTKQVLSLKFFCIVNLMDICLPKVLKNT